MNAIKSRIPRTGAVLAALLFALTACHPRSHLFEPSPTYAPQRRHIEKLPSEFREISSGERETEWGKELIIGRAFAREFDFYRAITSLKRAVILMPDGEKDRRMQAEYYIIQSYFLSWKYQEAIETFEFGAIRSATGAFPAFRDLLVMLYESYLKTGQCEKAQAVMYLMEKGDPESALELKLFASLTSGDLECVATLARNHPHCSEFNGFINRYCSCSKSVKTAQFLNAALPGAGYYYVGQKKSALTSLVLNTSFIAATWYFFNQGNWGAGLFTASLEFGWYFGGINGAGLAAKQYNECLYNDSAKNLMIEKGVFPVLMLQTGF